MSAAIPALDDFDDTFDPADLPAMPHGEAAFDDDDALAEFEPVVRTGKASQVDLAAERALLLALFTDPSLLDQLAGRVVGADFATLKHELIFDAISALDSRRGAIDPVTVCAELDRMGALHRAGSEKYVREVAAVDHDLSTDAAVAGFEDYIEIIYDRATRRRIHSAARKAMDVANDSTVATDEVITAAEQAISDVSSSRAVAVEVSMVQAISAATTKMALARNSNLMGHSTGFAMLDEMSGGFRPGQMITIAARPAMGKSVLALQFLTHIARTTGDLCPFFSYEMTAAELATRMVATESGVSLTDLNKGRVPEHKERDFHRALQELEKLPLVIIDKPPTTMNGVRAMLRRMSRKAKIGMWALDYLQLVGMEGMGRNGNREQEVSAMSRMVKTTSDELETPVAVVSQLNRGPEARPDKRPLMSDLRESGAIEQDSGLILFPYRHSVYDPEHPGHDAELIVAKNRFGRTGTVHVDWDGAHSKFIDTDRTEPVGGPADAFASGMAGSPWEGRQAAPLPQWG